MNTEYIDPIKIQNIKVAVDAVCFAKENGEEFILLIKREYEPFKDHWAVPGGFLKSFETLEDGVKRELVEETRIEKELGNDKLVQIGVFADLNRDPRPKRVISIAYKFSFDARYGVSSSDEALEVKWINLKDLSNIDLAFDHREIIEAAMRS